MSSPQIQLGLWILQPVLQTVVAIVMFRRRLYKDFPVFFAFILAQIAVFSIEFPIYRLGYDPLYFYVFWSAAALNLILDFKIIHEVFLDVFRPYHALKDLGTALFKWAALIMILISVVLISTSPGWNDPMAETILIVQRCVRVVQCGMVLFLLAFCKYLGVSWRRQSFGIVLGFGAFAGAELLTTALHSGGHIHASTLNFVNMACYNCSVGLWLWYSLMNRKELRIPVLVPQRWDEALTDLQPPTDSESLIPMFEHMVDRAFSRAQDTHA